MNETLQGMAQMLSPGLLISKPDLMPVMLTQGQTLPGTTTTGNVFQQVQGNLGISLVSLLQAIVILVVGWLIALIAAAIVRGLLKRTNVDNRLANWIRGERDTAESPPVEKWISGAVFWIIFIFTIVAFLEALQLAAVSAPLNNFLNQVIGYIPALLGALILLAVAWVVATIVRLVVIRALNAFGIDERLEQQTDPRNHRTSRTVPPEVLPGEPAPPADPPAVPFSLSETIGNALYWFVFLLFLPAILNALGLQGTLQPVQAMLNQILAILPNLFAAFLVLAVGWVIGQIVRRVVTLALTGIGFNNLFYWLGLQSFPSSSPSVPPPAQPGTTVSGIGTSPVAGAPPPTPRKTPSEVVGIVAWVGVMLFAALAAIDILNIPALTVLIGGIILIAGQILSGLIVFAIGLYLANLVFNLIAGSGGRQARILGQTARIAIITLISAMALQQIGVASSIVNLAFGLLVGGIAVAVALAFGLGGRDVAAEQLRSWLSSFKS